MEKILTQEDIDLLFRAAQRAGGVAAPAVKRITKTCDFRHSGQLSKEQVHAVTMLHEDFAPNLTNSLGAYLRAGFQAGLVSVEQLAYSEFLGRVSELTYLSTLALQPMYAQAAAQIDMPLVFPMIDLLLGGSGIGQPEARDLTEIEEQIMESVVAIVCRELQLAWRALLAIDFQPGPRLRQSQIQSFMMPGERVLALSFELKLAGTSGMLNLIFPAGVSNIVLRKLAQLGSLQRRRTSAESVARLRERILGCEIDVELSLRNVQTTIRALVELRPGQVLSLRRSVHEPMALTAAGRPIFLGLPVSCGAMRGALVKQIQTVATREEQEAS
ncbi:MAG: FliM/FliN family flagellar motor switch protein [Candidatus Acidiferrales bacterium]